MATTTIAALRKAVEDMVELDEDFGKCFDLAGKIVVRNPDAPGAWQGTVPERLTALFNYLQPE
jgi:hypothetical protein